jgi:hypothetical protein
MSDQTTELDVLLSSYVTACKYGSQAGQAKVRRALHTYVHRQRQEVYKACAEIAHEVYDCGDYRFTQMSEARIVDSRIRTAATQEETPQ